MFGGTISKQQNVSLVFDTSFYLLSFIVLGFCCFFPHTLNWIRYPFFSKDRIYITPLTDELICWKPNFIYATLIAILFMYSLLMLFPLDSRPPFIYFNF